MSSLTRRCSSDYSVRYTSNIQEIINELEPMNQILNTQDNFIEATKCGAFVVGSVSAEGVLSFARNPVVHNGHTAARTECSRLSDANPGRLYIFVRLTGGQIRPASTPVSF